MSNSTRPETSGKNHAVQKDSNQLMIPNLSNPNMASKNPSQSSFDVPYTLKSQSSKPSFVSPNAAAGAPRFEIAPLSATASKAAGRREKFAHRSGTGTLKDIYLEKL